MRYRECARSLYNTYFKDWGDGSHDFLNVDNGLFSALVLCRLSKWPTNFKWHEPVEFIRVNYRKLEAELANGLECHRRAGKRGIVQEWSGWTLKGDGTELAFVNFFDFSNTRDFMDFQLVECHVTESTPDSGLFTGDRLLIDAQHVTFEELTEKLGGGLDAPWLAAEKANQQSEIE
jgi:hypothetical protein